MILDLRAASEAFGQQIQDLLETVLPSAPGPDTEQRQIKVLRHSRYFVVRSGTTEKPGSISLLSAGKPVAKLYFSYLCSPDQAGTYLAVRKSTFQLTSLQEGPPLLRLDYDHKMHSAPQVHWNVHAERGATSVLLARCNPKHHGLLSQVHLPVGGTRYRPCLEDFLEMLVVEFNIDRLPRWRESIQHGRQQWRQFQVRSAVRDWPEQAVAVLESLGYDIATPSGGHPVPNADALRAR